MTALQRLTVEYIPEEDRVRISGERAGAAPLAIWLTRRLLDRILPELLKWIEREGSDLPGANTGGGKGAGPTVPRADLLHSFAQQAARSRLTPQTPVNVATDGEAWLVQTVNLTRGGSSIRLTFQSAGGQSATVTLATQALRQWLNILHDTYRRADWPLQVWPEWVCEASPRPQGQQAVRH